MNLKELKYKKIPALKDKEWKLFVIGEIFQLKKGKCSNASILNNGTMPYVGATNRNNGVLKYVEEKNKMVSDGNCIAFIGAGDGSAGFSIYKKEKFVCASSNVCGYNEHLNEYNGLFISACSDMNESKYSHGYSRNMERLSRDKIMLPVDSTGEPDYEYMEQYVKNMEQSKIIDYVAYISKELAGLKYEKIPTLKDKEWKAFKISDLFNIEHGKRLVKENRKNGKIPLLTASENNQGVSDYISNEELKCYTDFISIDMFGHAFYHSYKCKGDDNIYFCSNDTISSYAQIFITRMINQNAFKYSYGNQFRQGNANRDKIMLPVDSAGNPDYEYMEQYIKNIEYNKIVDYLGHMA